MNKTYLYEDSFSSLMALISYLIKNKISVNNIKSSNDYHKDLFDEPINVNISDELKRYTELKNKLSKSVFDVIECVYLSNNERKELIIYYLIINYFKYPSDILLRRNLNCVNLALNISEYVKRENHKLKGFLRFRLTKNNFYYAEMAPENNIIFLLARHFKKRLSTELWVIKDVKRNIYALFDKKKVYFLKEDDIVKFKIDKDLSIDNYEDLWTTFFKTIGIKERKNEKVQQNFMPKKYWQYMIEMDDINEKSDWQ